MILVILNPKSNAQQALDKWHSIKSQIKYDQMILLKDFLKNSTTLNPGDSVICAGGDGCLHSVVNRIIETTNLSFLSEISFGYIGLGSNNSYLQPIHRLSQINGIPVQLGLPTAYRDLIEITFGEQKKYIVSNASFGFLSAANKTFNQNPLVQLTKKLSVSVADLLSFIITLTQFKSIQVSINQGNFFISNLYFIKSPYFTKDLYFKDVTSLDSGNFDFFMLSSNSKINLFFRFFKMQVLRDMTESFDNHEVCTNLSFHSPIELPLEIDGEIYYGQSFHLKICPRALTVFI